MICTKIWPAEIDVLCQKIKNFSSSLISSLLNLDLSPFSSSSSSSSSIVKKEEPEGVKEEEMDNMETEEGEKEALITEVRRLTFLYFSLMREVWIFSSLSFFFHLFFLSFFLSFFLFVFVLLCSCTLSP